MRYIDEFRKDREEHPERYRAGTAASMIALMAPAEPTSKRRSTGLDFNSPTYSRDYSRLVRKTARGREQYMRSNLKMHHSITLEEYNALYTKQRGLCGICKCPITKGFDPTSKQGRGPKGNMAHVDHDHGCCPGQKTCGRCIRGLLCGRCNSGMGQFRDKAELLEAAASYIRRTRP